MSFNATMMKSTLVLLTSMLLLSGCANGRSVIVSGPKLSYPPPAAVEALIETAKKDAGTAAWFDDLDRYFTKLETTNQ
jgi:uncharacterized lipoprotein YajG